MYAWASVVAINKGGGSAESNRALAVWAVFVSTFCINKLYKQHPPTGTSHAHKPKNKTQQPHHIFRKTKIHLKTISSIGLGELRNDSAERTAKVLSTQ